MKIQIFKPKYRINECLEEIKECLEMGWTGMGFKTEQIEEKWKEYTSFQTHISLCYCWLTFIFRDFKERFNWSEGDEVITHHYF